jgi:hypothetical protein
LGSRVSQADVVEAEGSRLSSLLRSEWALAAIETRARVAAKRPRKSGPRAKAGGKGGKKKKGKGKGKGQVRGVDDRSEGSRQADDEKRCVRLQGTKAIVTPVEGKDAGIDTVRICYLSQTKYPVLE